MTDCSLCRSFGEEVRDDRSGTWYCGNEAVSQEDFNDALMDDADCSHWYPGEQQTVYTLGEGEWEHRCSRIPTDCMVVWGDETKAWYLWVGINDGRQILCCPWCGIELQPMPTPTPASPA